jgi:hypothetical protein
MNKLIIGLADKTAELIPEKPGFLLIDDGPVADAFLQKFKRAKQFDPHADSFKSAPHELPEGSGLRRCGLWRRRQGHPDREERQAGARSAAPESEKSWTTWTEAEATINKRRWQ